jgi:hypothetical protein
VADDGWVVHCTSAWHRATQVQLQTRPSRVTPAGAARADGPRPLVPQAAPQVATVAGWCHVKAREQRDLSVHSPGSVPLSHPTRVDLAYPVGARLSLGVGARLVLY